MRLDKWLWAARFYKTRSQAKNAVLKGHIRLNDEVSKPSKEVRIGDLLAIRAKSCEWTINVEQLREQRVSAQLAQQMYIETKPSKEARLASREQHRNITYQALRPASRPNKSDRRRLAQLKKSGGL